MSTERNQLPVAVAIITLAVGLLLVGFAAGVDKRCIDALDLRLQAVERHGMAYSTINSDGSVFLQEADGTRRWYRSAVDMPITNSIVSLEFADGVRYGLIAKAQNPNEDSIWKLTTIAQRLRQIIVTNLNVSNLLVTNWTARPLAP